ncbi:hypothetical protein HDU86_004102 [Geranomyces michiganensis]|nr:hypothetical protein HDU86_004102 [Geranomyces michiganensis]
MSDSAPDPRRRGRFMAFLTVTAYMYNVANMAVRAFFLAFYPARCSPDLHAYFITTLVVDAVERIPSTPLTWFVAHRRPHWANRAWWTHVKSLWTACQVVDAAAFIYGVFAIFRRGTCREQNPHLWYLLVAEITLASVMMGLPLLVCCCLSVVFRKRILAYRRAQMANAEGGNTGDDSYFLSTGLTLAELASLRTWVFGEQRNAAEAGPDDELRVQDLEASVARRTSSSSNKTPSVASIETCSICIAEYAPGDRLRELSCGHRFHQECIDGWLRPDPATRTKGHRTCPLCVGPAVRQDEAAGVSENGKPAAGGEAMPELLDRLENLTNQLEPRQARRHSLRGGGASGGSGTAAAAGGAPSEPGSGGRDS